MATTLVPLREYLHTSYRPDCDYIDGTLLDRNVGQYEHARLQGLIVTALMNREREWRIHVLPEQRVRIREARYRVPDVIVLAEDAPRPRLIEQAPLLCIEVLSPEDRLSEISERAYDYQTLGVGQAWIFDPVQKRVYVYSAGGLHENAPDQLLVLKHAAARVELLPAELFKQI